MWLPVSTASAAAWVLWDFRQETLSSDPADAGSCSVQLGPVPQDELWLIDRMVVSSDSAADTTAGVFLDTVDPTRAIDGTTVGNFDVADLASPIQVPGGTTLVCAWQGASDDATGVMRVQYQVMRKPT